MIARGANRIAMRVDGCETEVTVRHFVRGQDRKDTVGADKDAANRE